MVKLFFLRLIPFRGYFMFRISSVPNESPQNIALTDARSFAAPEFIAVMLLNAYSTQLQRLPAKYKTRTRHFARLRNLLSGKLSTSTLQLIMAGDRINIFNSADTNVASVSCDCSIFGVIVIVVVFLF